eukprot:2682819-Amphidinium_carterae.1
MDVHSSAWGPVAHLACSRHVKALVCQVYAKNDYHHPFQFLQRWTAGSLGADGQVARSQLR